MGGGSNYFQSQAERETAAYQQRKRAEAMVAARSDERRKFAERAVMILVDHINDKIIRPGPTPEERECYDMAQELHDAKAEMTGLLIAMLDVSDGVPCTRACETRQSHARAGIDLMSYCSAPAAKVKNP